MEDCGWGKFSEKGLQFFFVCFFLRRSVLDTFELKCSFDIQVEMTRGQTHESGVWGRGWADDVNLGDIGT